MLLLAACTATPSMVLAHTTRPEKPRKGLDGAWENPAKVWKDAQREHAHLTAPCIPAGTEFTAPVTVTIARDGTVDGAEFHLSAADPPMVAECLAAQIRTWSFPPASEVVTLRRFKWSKPAAEQEAADLKKAFRRHMIRSNAAITECLKGQEIPEAGLAVRVTLRVEPDGRVTEVKLQGPKDKERQHCLAVAFEGEQLKVALRKAVIMEMPLTVRRAANKSAPGNSP